MIKRFQERQVSRTPKRSCTGHGDREELFMFKEERLIYLNQIALYLLRHNKFATAAVSAKKKANAYRKYFYNIALTHVTGGTNDNKFPVEVFTGDPSQVNPNQFWEPVTYRNRSAQSVILVADGEYVSPDRRSGRGY